MNDKDRNRIGIFLEYFNSTNSDLCIMDKDLNIIAVSDGYLDRHGITNQFVGITASQVENNHLFYPSVGALCAKEGKKVTIMQTNVLGQHVLSTAGPIFDQNGNLEYIVCYNSIDIADCFSAPEKLQRAQEIVRQYSKDLSIEKLEKLVINELNSRSNRIDNTLRLINQISDTSANVVITGETGVGKNLTARIIHQKSQRSNESFVEINCGAIPCNLIESELFGYEPGAFTGASKLGKFGKIEMAEGGTLFLDEISELPLEMQTKLLQVIQNKQITHVGGNKPIDVDFRLIVATNKNLAKEVKEKRFREDLFYRLNVIPIHIPAIRERPEDIFPLVMTFLKRFNIMYDKDVWIADEAMKLIELQEWLGNIREIENFIERLVILSENNIITASDLPFDDSHIDFVIAKEKHHDLKSIMDDYEKHIITNAYNQCGSSVAVGHYLNISQTTAARKLRKYIPGYSDK